jgi:hypothetical protein
VVRFLGFDLDRAGRESIAHGRVCVSAAVFELYVPNGLPELCRVA